MQTILNRWCIYGNNIKYEEVLVLNGDMPLIQAERVKKFDLDATIVMSVLELQKCRWIWKSYYWKWECKK